MANLRQFIVFVCGIVFCVGCGTSPSTPSAPSALFEPEVGDRPIWFAWTPLTGVQKSVPDLSREMVAFDYWRIRDDKTQRALWRNIYPVLDMMRLMKKSSKSSQTMAALMTLLDKSPKSSRWLDVTFVVDRAYQWEGILYRLYGQNSRGAVYGLSILLKRSVRQSKPFEAVVWGVSGFEQGKPFSVSIRRVGKLGELRWQGALTYVFGEVESRSAHIALFLDILHKGIWAKVTGTQFVEPKISIDKTRQKHLDSFPVAAGLSIRGRQLEEVLNPTLFVPNIDVDRLEFGRPGTVN